MSTKLVNGEPVDVPADELTALQAEWAANALIVRKNPIQNWAARAALGDTRVSLVDGIIDGMDAGDAKTRIKAKWDRGTVIIWSHPDTQMMVTALAQADATFDADAMWAAAEAMME